MCTCGLSFLSPGVDQDTRETQSPGGHQCSPGIRPHVPPGSGGWSLKGWWGHLVQRRLDHWWWRCLWTENYGWPACWMLCGETLRWVQAFQLPDRHRECAQLAGSLAMTPASLVSRRARDNSSGRSEHRAIWGPGCGGRLWKPTSSVKHTVLGADVGWDWTGLSRRGWGPAFLPLETMAWAVLWGKTTAVSRSGNHFLSFVVSTKLELRKKF